MVYYSNGVSLWRLNDQKIEYRDKGGTWIESVLSQKDLESDHTVTKGDVEIPPVQPFDEV